MAQVKAGRPVASMTVTCVKARTSLSDTPQRSRGVGSRWDTRLMVPTAREFPRNSRRVVAIRSPSTGWCRRRSVTCLRVENQLHQMTELCPVETGWQRSVRNLCNGLGILDRRIVVRAMHDDHVQGRNDENVMSPISPRGINPGKRDFREMNTAVVNPPEILVTAVIRTVVLHHLTGVTAFFDPGFRHDLFAVPAAVTDIEQAETSHIARRHLEVVSGMSGEWTAEIEDVARLEILHANRFGYALVKGIANLQASPFFQDRA